MAVRGKDGDTPPQAPARRTKRPTAKAPPATRPEAQEARVEPENKGTATLLAAMTLVTGIFAAVGVTGGMLGRMARNERPWTIGALAGAVAALLCGAIAVWVVTTGAVGKRRKATLERRFFAAGIVLLLAAGTAAAWAAVSVWGDRTQPRLSATVAKSSAGTTLDIHLQASSLHSGDRLTLFVKPVVWESPPDLGRYSYKTGNSIFRTSVGPDINGDVDQQLRVPLDPGRYRRLVVSAFAVGDASGNDCYRKGSGLACVTLALPEPERPQLAAAWVTTTRTGARVLNVTASAHDVPSRTVVARVVGAVAPHRHRLLAEWALAPDVNGDFTLTQRVSVPRDVRAVCVVASTVLRRAAMCPQRYFAVPGFVNPASVRAKRLTAKQRGTVWLVLRAPDA